MYSNRSLRRFIVLSVSLGRTHSMMEVNSSYTPYCGQLVRHDSLGGSKDTAAQQQAVRSAKKNTNMSAACNTRVNTLKK